MFQGIVQVIEAEAMFGGKTDDHDVVVVEVEAVPWTETPDMLQSMGLQRVGHN